MWVVSTAIGALPTPKDDSSQVYEFFFKFLTGIGAGLARLMAVYSPSTLTALTGQSVQPVQPKKNGNGSTSSTGTLNGASGGPTPPATK